MIDAKGYLVSPPFIDAHFHMDATLSLGMPRVNASGTLLEGIALWGELKPLLTHEAVIERAMRYCDLAVSQGLLAIRTHVDVCDDRLLCVESLLEVRKRVKTYIDLQIVAFPQDGFYRDPHAKKNLLRALDLGVDIVGGIPHGERTMADGARSMTELCEIAAERGLLVDIHCDETDDPLVAPCRGAGLRDAAAGAAGARRGLAPHLHAFDGQLLCLEADRADGGGAAACNAEPAHQHHAAGAARHLPQAPRHDARAGTARGGHQRLLRA